MTDQNSATGKRKLAGRKKDPRLPTQQQPGREPTAGKTCRLPFARKTQTTSRARSGAATVAFPVAMAILEQQRRSSTNKVSSGRIQEAIAHTNSGGPENKPTAHRRFAAHTNHTMIRDNKRKSQMERKSRSKSKSNQRRRQRRTANRPRERPHHHRRKDEATGEAPPSEQPQGPPPSSLFTTARRFPGPPPSLAPSRPPETERTDGIAAGNSSPLFTLLPCS
jgi:hypothetical protein